MPELPEVETVVRDLRPLLIGRRFTAVRAGERKMRVVWSPAWEKQLVGRKVQSVRRRGKWILIDLKPVGLFVVHLGMTGQLRVFSADEEMQDHVHLVVDLDNGSQLRFRDIRRFGSATLHTGESDWAASRREELGPEPFDLTGEYLREALGRTDRSLKAILLDQKVLAGVGNIYADEALHRANLEPTRRGRDLTPAEVTRLRKAIVEVLERAIEFRGSTIRNYVGGSGLKGGFQEKFRVYGRTGEPCRKCRTPIACIRLAGRSTHYCPKCQGGSPLARR